MYLYDDFPEEIVELSDEEKEECYLRDITQRDFSDKARIIVDEVITNVTSENMSKILGDSFDMDDFWINIQDVTEEYYMANEKELECLVIGKITDDLTSFDFTAAVYNDDSVMVAINDSPDDIYDLKEKAAFIVEERLCNYL